MGPSSSPKAATAWDRGIPDPALPGFGQPRRGHVNGLLEERPIQGIGFVEEGKDDEPSAVENPLQGHLPARNISFDEDMLGRVPQGCDVGLLQNSRDAVEGGDEFIRIVRLG